MKKYFTNQDISEMNKNAKGICISLYMQTPRENRKENLIRLKNKLSEVKSQLHNLNMDIEEIQTITDSAKQFLKDTDIMGKLEESIAFFYSNKKVYGYTIPIKVTEKIEIGNDFILEPLEEFLKSNTVKYYVLMLDQNNIKLYKATPFEMEELDLGKFPRNIDEYYKDIEYDNRTLQNNGRTVKTGSNNSNVGVGFYSSGDNISNDKKSELNHYFSELDKVITKILNGKKEPLVLVGTENLFPVYKKVNNYEHLLDNGVKGSPDTLKMENIRKETLNIVNR